MSKTWKNLIEQRMLEWRALLNGYSMQLHFGSGSPFLAVSYVQPVQVTIFCQLQVCDLTCAFRHHCQILTKSRHSWMRQDCTCGQYASSLTRSRQGNFFRDMLSLLLLSYRSEEIDKARNARNFNPVVERAFLGYICP